MIRPETISNLQSAVPGLAISEFRGQTRVVASRDKLYAVLSILKNERGFDLLVDITCVDYLNYRGATDRFGLVYLLTAVDSNERITVRTFLNEPDLSVPTAVPLWLGAEWLEEAPDAE